MAHRSGLLKHVIEAKIKRRGRRGIRRKQLLSDLKETRRYWKISDEAPDSISWGTRFGKCYGSFVTQGDDDTSEPGQQYVH
jgi:hypothetical protein